MNADKIVQQLCQCGYEAYIVGGAVRDMLLNKDPEDEDVVTNASPEEIATIFKEEKIDLVGASFLVTLVNGIEVSTYRKDINKKPGRENCEVTQCETLLEDLHKRDFTINAIATCPYTGEIIDPFNGQKDLQNKVIKFVGDPNKRIYEDYLRMIRAARFCALLNATLDFDSSMAIIENRHLVKQIAPERIRLELLKVMGYEKPSIFFDVLHETGILNLLLPDLDKMYGHDGGKYHDETLDKHFKMTGDNLPPDDKILRLAGYLHDIGKPISYSITNGESFINHEKYGAALLGGILRRLKFSNAEIYRIENLVRFHMRSLAGDITDKSVRKMLRKFKENNVDWNDWLRLKIADKKANLKNPDYTDEEIKSFVLKIKNALEHKNKAFSVKDLNINGHDIMSITNLPQGKHIGNILDHLLNLVIDTPELNTNEELTRIVNANFNFKESENDKDCIKEISGSNG